MAQVVAQAQVEKRPTGRPHVPAVEARTYCMVVRLSAAELEIVRQLAARDGFCPISTYTRQLLLSRAAAVLGEQEEDDR